MLFFQNLGDITWFFI